MKFDKPRVFRYRDSRGCVWQVVFSDSEDCVRERCVEGRDVGKECLLWKFDEMFDEQERGRPDAWREVTPFDITKLDCAGVFHEEEKPNVLRFFFNANSFAMIRVQYETPCEAGWVEVMSPDIANATIAELRARVAELESQVKKRDATMIRIRDCVENVSGYVASLVLADPH